MIIRAGLALRGVIVGHADRMDVLLSIICPVSFYKLSFHSQELQ